MKTAILILLMLLPTVALAEVEEVLVVGSKITTGYSDPAHDNSAIEAIEST